MEIKKNEHTLRAWAREIFRQLGRDWPHLNFKLSFDGNRTDKKKLEAEGGGDHDGGDDQGASSVSPMRVSRSSSVANSPATPIMHGGFFSPTPPVAGDQEDDDDEDDDAAAAAGHDGGASQKKSSGKNKAKVKNVCDLSKLRTDQIVVQFETESQVR